MRFWAAILALLLWPTMASAQAYQCRPPASFSPPNISKPAKEQRRSRPVAGYVMALSWSPEFCRTRQNDRRHATQCGGNAGRFGFILHGLWPEASDARYPQWCREVRPPRASVAKRHFCMMPSARLQAHEWAKHGSCMVRSPENYLKVSQILFDAVRWPDMDGLSRKPLTVAQFRAAFAAANQGLSSDMIQLKVNGRGWLQEVRVCLSKRFRPRKCPAHMRPVPGGRELKIWRGA